MMKKISSLTLWVVLFGSIGIAERVNSSTCFMLDANGNQMNLGYLCQNSAPKQNRLGDRVDYYPTSPEPSDREKGVYTVPIKSRRAGIPVIDVNFNDRYVFEMMLDTGASEIVITQQMAKKLRVHHHKNVLVSTPSNSRVTMSSGYVYSVGVGELYKNNPLVITAPSMDMGLLGQSFFSGYDMTIKSDVIEFRER